MLMPKQNRVAIYEHLFKEGVMVAKKDFNQPKHDELDTVPNLQVRCLSPSSFKSNTIFRSSRP